MNMRKIIAVLAAVLMLCAIVPMGAMSVSAAPGDVIIEKNFDDGSYFSNGSNENGYMVFDATTANWANVYLYANAIKSGTKYEISFDCKADKATNINVKINNNWSGDTFKWTTNVTTEWVTYTCVINPDELATLTSTALLMFTSNTYASSGAVYHIDNVKVVEYADPELNGKIVNGSFEDGTNGWSTNSAASLVADAQDGSQALQMSNPSAWASVATQTIPVEANASYEITWYSKRLSGTGAFNLIACQAVSPWSNYTKVAGQNWMNETSGEWVANTYTVNVGDNTSMLLKFTTEATNPGEILIDNVVVSKLKDPSFDGYIYNGDFETGKVNPWTVYSGTAVSADAAKDGDYGLYIKNPTGGWGGTAYQNFTTEAGKTYVVMMDAKALSNGQNIQIKDNGTTKASKWFSTTSWTTLSFEYTAESTAGTINICGGGTSANEEIYVDNIFVFEKKAASNDGYIVNGDFETGTTEGLTPYQSTCVSRDAAKDGNFGLKMMGNGGWGGVGLWTITGLEAGATYKFEMDMNAIEQGFNWTLWQDSTSSGVKYASGYFSTKAWTTIEKEFVANSDKAVLNINGGGNGNAETVYLDNLKITLVKCATCVSDSAACVDGTCTKCGNPVAASADHTYDNDYDADCNVCGAVRAVVNPVAFGGNSRSDDVSGLAFKFNVAVDDMAVNGTTAIYDAATIDGNKLISMGAIVSNAKSELDIPAVYLCDLEADSASFAVRVINIPEANYGDEITAVPYFVVEIDGVETTIYGEAQVASYNG
ncbi:MAG: carbohydrate binding domain-containing protein [Clostridia bacterium]|nr:carbohydrate binding domain-containing protein [Clostridia bacterium]